jgi:hypothetical protein
VNENHKFNEVKELENSNLKLLECLMKYALRYFSGKLIEINVIERRKYR